MKLINDDCMNILPKYEDNYFDLAIVDPPYALKRNQRGDLRLGGRQSNSNSNSRGNYSEQISWDVTPTKEYFDELFRVSKNQIIWGANNFELPTSEYFCVWNKKQTVENFASAELGWVSMGLKTPAKVFEYSIHQHNQIDKMHPTQKPVALYRWLLETYAEPTDKILDTHLGSGSSAIACHYFGTEEFIGIEIDKEYFDMASERIAKETRQIKLL